MIRYGFEVEAFYMGGEIPPKNYPVDGFPGLIEYRTSGGNNLNQAYGQIISQMTLYPNFSLIPEHVFSPEQKSILRRERHFEKDNLIVYNLYGRKPRDAGRKTLASFQINISNVVREGFVDANKVRIPTVYGLLNIPEIVRNLDEEFNKEIKNAKRQPGMYSIKDDDSRLEYRSLPNSSFVCNPVEATIFLNRIKKAVEG